MIFGNTTVFFLLYFFFSEALKNDGKKSTHNMKETPKMFSVSGHFVVVLDLKSSTVLLLTIQSSHSSLNTNVSC